MQKINVQHHELNTSAVLNRRLAGVMPAGVYSGFRVKANAGQGNLLDIVRAGAPTSVLVTSEGVIVEETTDLVGVLAIEPASPNLFRKDLVVCEYKASTNAQAKAVYRVIRGPEQIDASKEPVAPKPSSSFQVPLATIMVRPKKTFGGATSANILPVDIYPTPKAQWIKEELVNLKPEIDATDSRRVYVYPGIFPSADGKSLVHFPGGYSEVIPPSSLEDSQSRIMYLGITDDGLLEFFSEKLPDTEVDLSADVVPVAEVTYKKIVGSVVAVDLRDIRSPLSRRFSSRDTERDYKALLQDSVFKFLRVVDFQTESDVLLDSVKLFTAADSNIQANIDTTDSSLKIMWTGSSATPPSEVEITTADLIFGSGSISCRQILLAADTSFDGLRFRYSTTSPTSGFSSQFYSLDEVVRIPTSGASRLFLKLLIPPGAFFTEKFVKIYSLGLLINLDDTSLNSSTVQEFGLDALRRAGLQNLIANGGFTEWGGYSTDGQLAEQQSQVELEYAVTETMPVAASGWQAVSFGAGLLGQVVQRSFVQQVVPALKFTTAGSATPLRTVFEYQISSTDQLADLPITFAIDYSAAVPSTFGIAVVLYETGPDGSITQAVTERVATASSGTLFVVSDRSVGLQTTRIGFRFFGTSGAAPSTFRVWQARALVGAHTAPPFARPEQAAAGSRALMERGSIFQSLYGFSGSLVGTSVQLGARKAAELGSVVAMVGAHPGANRSSNLSDLNASATPDSLIISSTAASDGSSLFDLDWVVFVRYAS